MASAAPVEGGDAAVRPHRDEAGAHRLEDEVAKGLHVGEVALLGFQARLRHLVALGHRAGHDGAHQEDAGVEEDGEHLQRGGLARLEERGERQDGAPNHEPHVEEAREPCHHEAAHAGEEEAALHDREHVEEGEERARAPAGGDDGGDEDGVEGDEEPGEVAPAPRGRPARDEGQRATGRFPAWRGRRGGTGRERRPRGGARARPRTRAPPSGAEPSPARGGPFSALTAAGTASYLISVTSRKIGRYMATTRPPMITPRTTIIRGSRSAVNAPTAVSTSSS